MTDRTRLFASRKISENIYEIYLDSIFVGLVKPALNKLSFYPKKQGTLCCSFDSEAMRAIANFIDVIKL